MTTLPNLANKALEKSTVKPLKIVEQMLCDLLAVPASKVRDYAVIHSQPNAISYEIFSQQIFDKISLIDEEKLVNPEPQIIGQAINDSAYCYYNEKLSSKFSSLIANSCNIDYVALMHPSFSKTLSCMTPYDATLFQKIAEHENYISAAEYTVHFADFSIYNLLHRCIIFTDDFFSNYDMQSLSVSALKQLGVIEYTPPTPSKAHDRTFQKKFVENDYFVNLQKKCEQYYRTHAEAKETFVYLTPYGRAFAIACSCWPLEKEKELLGRFN